MNLFGSPSRSSTASRVPVDAPEGTIARPSAPDSSSTSTSTVGFPRESRTSLPCTSTIIVMPRSSSIRCRWLLLRVDEFLAAFADRKHGARRHADDLLGGAAEDDPLHPGAAVRPDDDQPRPALAGLTDDLAVGD